MGEERQVKKIYSGNYCVEVDAEYYFQRHRSLGSEPDPLLVFLHGMHQSDQLFTQPPQWLHQ